MLQLGSDVIGLAPCLPCWPPRPRDPNSCGSNTLCCSGLLLEGEGAYKQTHFVDLMRSVSLELCTPPPIFHVALICSCALCVSDTSCSLWQCVNDKCALRATEGGLQQNAIAQR